LGEWDIFDLQPLEDAWVGSESGRPPVAKQGCFYCRIEREADSAAIRCVDVDSAAGSECVGTEYTCTGCFEFTDGY